MAVVEVSGVVRVLDHVVSVMDPPEPQHQPLTRGQPRVPGTDRGLAHTHAVARVVSVVHRGLEEGGPVILTVSALILPLERVRRFSLAQNIVHLDV